jgi:hypothetical protein
MTKTITTMLAQPANGGRSCYQPAGPTAPYCKLFGLTVRSDLQAVAS